MQEEIANTSPRIAPDFAGLLAALAAAKLTELPRWNDEELPQDVSTLSYERALRKHARYKSQDVADIGTVKPTEIPTGRTRVGVQSVPDARSQVDGPLKESGAAVPMSGRERKCASVTIRMSRAECEQLRERAAEAGLTISAYLRSCTFEAEALRAQVKQALAELRSSNASKPSTTLDSGMQTEGVQKSQPHSSGQSASVAGSRLSWLRRIMPDMHPARNLARA